MHRLLSTVITDLQFQEMESYMGHIRDMAVKRADSLQFEAVELRSQMDNIVKLLGNAKLPTGSVDHQVNYRTKFSQ